MLSRLLLLVGPVVAVFCLERGGHDQPPATAPSRREVSAADEWIDDSRLQANMLEGAIALADAERAPELSKVMRGLSQPTCSLELPPEKLPAGGAGEHTGEAKVNAEALYERALESVVLVGTLYRCERCTEWHTSSATGFFITPGGALVTNYHVVDQIEHRALVVMTYDGRVFPVLKTLAGNKEADVAIVQVDPVDHKGRRKAFAPLSLADRSRIGQNVRVIHHADHRYYTLTSGIVSRRYVDDDEAGTQWITITADYARGSSGGPVFDDEGRVIGIVASTHSVYYSRGEEGDAQNLQMVWKQCVPVENIRALIADD